MKALMVVVILAILLSAGASAQVKTYVGRSHTAYVNDSTGNTVGGAGPWVVSVANDSTTGSLYMAICTTARADSSFIIYCPTVGSAGDVATVEVPALHHFRMKSTIANFPYHVMIQKKVR